MTYHFPSLHQAMGFFFIVSATRKHVRRAAWQRFGVLANSLSSFRWIKPITNTSGQTSNLGSILS
jgi:hypothetical protein